MLVYSPVITPRLVYITQFIGNELFGKSLSLTSDPELFKNAQEPRINYSDQTVSENEIRVNPHPLLGEKNIKSQDITGAQWEGMPALFPTPGDIPFDLLAATFYLLSRYEEYLPHQKDLYGRYAHGNSIAHKKGFLHQPLVNRWLKEFRRLLKERFPGIVFHSPSFSFLPTYDIDEAWSYKFKSAGRNLGAAFKNFFKGEWSILAERRKVHAGKKADPFDAYAWMDTLHNSYQLEPRYFFLVPERTGRYDRNIPPSVQALQELILAHSKKYQVGVHPSWQSGDQPGLLEKEIKRIETITGMKIQSSRQHFIRLKLPDTYRQLLAAGIREDFSMGYGSINGFRASVASPFYWYDLEKEETTPLLLYPFCFMDANSFFEEKQDPNEALTEMRQYYEEVKSVNGLYCSIWHNTFLGTAGLFTGWREAYEQFVKEITAK